MKVLIPMDGSKWSETAVRQVASEQWPANTEVRLVFALELYPHDDPGAATLPPERYKELEEIERARAERFLRAGVETLIAGGFSRERVTEAIVIGSPKRAICEEAERWRADLIVIGSHGRGFWGRLALGSVASAVADQSPCSVRIVKI